MSGSPRHHYADAKADTGSRRGRWRTVHKWTVHLPFEVYAGANVGFQRSLLDKVWVISLRDPSPAVRRPIVQLRSPRRPSLGARVPARGCALRPTNPSYRHAGLGFFCLDGDGITRCWPNFACSVSVVPRLGPRRLAATPWLRRRRYPGRSFPPSTLLPRSSRPRPGIGERVTSMLVPIPARQCGGSTAMVSSSPSCESTGSRLGPMPTTPTIEPIRSATHHRCGAGRARS